MVKLTIYAGGYVSFIASYLFDTDAASLTLVKQNPSGANPSWITLNPNNRSVLYATNENSEGGLQSFVIQPEGSLTAALDTVSSGGNSPAHALALPSGQISVMNYGSGNGYILSTGEDLVTFGSAPLISLPVVASPGQSHPHMTYQYKDEVFIPDLGADKIYRLKESNSGNWSIQGSIAQPAGSGPRHIAIHDDILYTLHELSSTLTSQKIPSVSASTAALISNVSIVPPGAPSGATFAGGEILLTEASATFPKPYIYVSNRNTGVQDPKGDSIVIYSFDSRGKVTQVKQVYTGLDQVRGMEFGGEDNKYLVAAGVAGTAGVVIYERVNGGADLKEIVRNTDLPTATSFVWA